MLKKSKKDVNFSGIYLTNYHYKKVPRPSVAKLQKFENELWNVLSQKDQNYKNSLEDPHYLLFINLRDIVLKHRSIGYPILILILDYIYKFCQNNQNNLNKTSNENLYWTCFNYFDPMQEYYVCISVRILNLALPRIKSFSFYFEDSLEKRISFLGAFTKEQLTKIHTIFFQIKIKTKKVVIKISPKERDCDELFRILLLEHREKETLGQELKILRLEKRKSLRQFILLILSKYKKKLGKGKK